MQLSDLNGQKICILGFGKEGQATLAACSTLASPASITIADSQAITAPVQQKTITGADYLEQVDKQQFDVIIKSPGIPPHPLIEQWRKAGKLTSGTALFFAAAKAVGAKLIGVTGSKGKSTTSSLIYTILTAAKVPVTLVGNIGKPMLEYSDKLDPSMTFVAELSSYQLLDLEQSPDIAVITSFFPEHLDYHGSLQNYFEAKSHIARYQSTENTVIFAGDQPEVVRMASLSPGRKIARTAADSPIKLSELKLIGAHNLSNVALATGVANVLGIEPATYLAALRNFTGLPHRLQSLGVHHGIQWIDDAISTTPDSTIAALDALGDRVATIILGGQDRGVPYEHLGTRIAASKVRTVILFPGSGPRIRQAIGDAHADVCFHEVDTMQAAVEKAKKSTMEGKICLLSTAAPSYGMFKNFEEKGDEFARCIRS